MKKNFKNIITKTKNKNYVQYLQYITSINIYGKIKPKKIKNYYFNHSKRILNQLISINTILEVRNYIKLKSNLRKIYFFSIIRTIINSNNKNNNNRKQILKNEKNNISIELEEISQLLYEHTINFYPISYFNVQISHSTKEMIYKSNFLKLECPISVKYDDKFNFHTILSLTSQKSYINNRKSYCSSKYIISKSYEHYTNLNILAKSSRLSYIRKITKLYSFTSASIIYYKKSIIILGVNMLKLINILSDILSKNTKIINRKFNKNNFEIVLGSVMYKILWQKDIKENIAKSSNLNFITYLRRENKFNTIPDIVLVFLALNVNFHENFKKIKLLHFYRNSIWNKAVIIINFDYLTKIAFNNCSDVNNVNYLKKYWVLDIYSQIINKSIKESLEKHKNHSKNNILSPNIIIQKSLLLKKNKNQINYNLRSSFQKHYYHKDILSTQNNINNKSKICISMINRLKQINSHNINIITNLIKPPSFCYTININSNLKNLKNIIKHFYNYIKKSKTYSSKKIEYILYCLLINSNIYSKWYLKNPFSKIHSDYFQNINQNIIDNYCLATNNHNCKNKIISKTTIGFEYLTLKNIMHIEKISYLVHPSKINYLLYYNKKKIMIENDNLKIYNIFMNDSYKEIINFRDSLLRHTRYNLSWWSKNITKTANLHSQLQIRRDLEESSPEFLNNDNIEKFNFPNFTKTNFNNVQDMFNHKDKQHHIYSTKKSNYLLSHEYENDLTNNTLISSKYCLNIMNLNPLYSTKSYYQCKNFNSYKIIKNIISKADEQKKLNGIFIFNQSLKEILNYNKIKDKVKKVFKYTDSASGKETEVTEMNMEMSLFNCNFNFNLSEKNNLKPRQTRQLEESKEVENDLKTFDYIYYETNIIDLKDYALTKKFKLKTIKGNPREYSLIDKKHYFDSLKYAYTEGWRTEKKISNSIKNRFYYNEFIQLDKSELFDIFSNIDQNIPVYEYKNRICSFMDFLDEENYDNDYSLKGFELFEGFLILSSDNRFFDIPIEFAFSVDSNGSKSIDYNMSFYSSKKLSRKISSCLLAEFSKSIEYDGYFINIAQTLLVSTYGRYGYDISTAMSLLNNNGLYNQGYSIKYYEHYSFYKLFLYDFEISHSLIKSKSTLTSNILKGSLRMDYKLKNTSINLSVLFTFEKRKDPYFLHGYHFALVQGKYETNIKLFEIWLGENELSIVIAFREGQGILGTLLMLIDMLDDWNNSKYRQYYDKWHISLKNRPTDKIRMTKDSQYKPIKEKDLKYSYREQNEIIKNKHVWNSISSVFDFEFDRDMIEHTDCLIPWDPEDISELTFRKMFYENKN